MPVFGQIVVGPPGSGKTTYCNGMHEFLTGLKRPTIIVNLDPANENIPYTPAINVQDLVSVETVMETLDLGPNGAMIYCMDYLEKNLDWLVEQLRPYTMDTNQHYVIFDCPGQVELYTHQQSVRKITEALQKLDYRLCAVHLVDAHYCSDPSKFISALLVSLCTMTHLELPHINVLSKIDLIQQYGKLAFDIDFYTDVQDLSYLLQHMQETASVHTNPMFTQLNQRLIEIIEEYGLVSYLPLDIMDKNSVYKVVQYVDKSNGYVFGALEGANMQQFASTEEKQWQHDRNDDVRNKFLHEPEDEDA